MTNQQASPGELDVLFVEDSEQAIDGLLRAALVPIIGFTRDGRMVTKPPFLKLPDISRILAALLARQAMIRLKLAGAKLEATPDQLENECGVSLKSCREHLSRLKARRMLDKNDAGYFVPTWAIADVCQTVGKNS